MRLAKLSTFKENETKEKHINFFLNAVYTESRCCFYTFLILKECRYFFVHKVLRQKFLNSFFFV